MNALYRQSLQDGIAAVNARREKSPGICPLVSSSGLAQTGVSGVGQRRGFDGPTSPDAAAAALAASGVASSCGHCDPWWRRGGRGARGQPAERRHHRGRRVHAGDLRRRGHGGLGAGDVSRLCWFDSGVVATVVSGSEVWVVPPPDGGPRVCQGLSGLRPDLGRLLTATRPTLSIRGQRPYRQSTI